MAQYNVTFDELDSLLKGLPANTVGTPYDICITEITKEQCTNARNFNEPGTLKYVLLNNYYRYINLSFTKLPDDFTDASYMFVNCSPLVSIDTSAFVNVTNASNMFYDCDYLSKIDASSFINTINASYMFYGCNFLKEIDTSGFVNVTNASNMFCGCNFLKEIDTASFINVTDASYMFGGCNRLNKIDTSSFANVTNASYMFYNCNNLSKIDASSFINTTNANHMFYYCNFLEEIDTSGFVNVADAGYMFGGCSLISIDISVFVNVTNAKGMFLGCGSLQYIHNWNFDYQKLSSFSYMLNECTSLTDIYCKDVIIPNPYDGSNFDYNTETYYNETVDFIRNKLSLSTLTIHKGSFSYSIPMLTPFVHLDRLLTQLPANTAGDSYTPGEPYNIEITEITKEQCTDRKTGVDTEDTLKYVLLQNRTKYISLSFSELPEDFTDASYMFYFCTNLTEIDTSGFVNITNASNMFYGCYNLKEIDTSSFINVTDTTYMFWSCGVLTEIDASSFVNVITANGMFASCYNLNKINTSGFINVTNAESMFEACDSLTEIDTSSFINVTNAIDMFYYCRNLKEIDASSFVNVTDAAYMFKGCAALTKINNFRFSISNLTSSRGMFEECTSLQEITVPKPVEKTPSSSLLNFSKSGNNLTVKYLPLNSDSVSEVTVEAGDTVTLTGVTDELLIDTSIGDELIEKMRDYKRKWSTDNRVLDPSKKNFILWADKDSNIVQNVVEGGDANEIINKLPTEADTPTDTDYFVSQHAGGNETEPVDNTYHRRPFSALWNWIKSKADSLYRSVTAPKSGAWFNGTPLIGSDGVTELGRYLDFHPTNDSTMDYGCRVDAGNSTTAHTLTLPNKTGTLACTSDISYPVTKVNNKTGAVTLSASDVGALAVSAGTPSSGYVKLSNGLLIQWGIVDGGSEVQDRTYTINFWVDFTVIPTVSATPMRDSGNVGWMAVGSRNLTVKGFVTRFRGDSSSERTRYCHWIAIGR